MNLFLDCDHTVKPVMAEIWDAVVVGAGIEGSSTAYNLAKQNYKALLIEQFPLPHSRGSSHGQTRITRHAYTHGSLYSKMMIEGHRLLTELEQESNMQLYIRNGCLIIGNKDIDLIKLAENSLTSIGAPYDKLDSTALRQRYPMFTLNHDDIALLDPRGGILLASKCLLAYQQQFMKLGGTLKDGEQVKSIRPGDVIEIVTDRGRYRTRRLIITAGPWTNQIIKPLGLHLPLKVERVSLMFWKTSDPAFDIRNGFPSFCYKEKDLVIYSTPMFEYPGLIKIAISGGPEVDPDNRDDQVDNTAFDKVKKFIQYKMKGIELTASIKENCLYTMTPDWDFILDHHPNHRNIIIGAGFSGHGFKLAPIVGQMLTQLAMDLPCSYNLKPFSIKRFSTGELRGPSAKL